jgi:hypothetical protein
MRLGTLSAAEIERCIANIIPLEIDALQPLIRLSVYAKPTLISYKKQTQILPLVTSLGHSFLFQL